MRTVCSCGDGKRLEEGIYDRPGLRRSDIGYLLRPMAGTGTTYRAASGLCQVAVLCVVNRTMLWTGVVLLLFFLERDNG